VDSSWERTCCQSAAVVVHTPQPTMPSPLDEFVFLLQCYSSQGK